MIPWDGGEKKVNVSCERDVQGLLKIRDKVNACCRSRRTVLLKGEGTLRISPGTGGATNGAGS